jgi:Fur family ferric uptake transcriptional regulator
VGDFHYLGWDNVNPDHTRIKRSCEAASARKLTMVENSELRKVGLKVTLPRVKILQMLDSAEQRHMSAEDVYKALMEANEDVGLATVYRVLTQFEAAGLVVRHNFDGGHAVFELADGGHHDHMVNVESGEVIEFFEEEIEKLQKAIVEKHGYELVDHNLVLYVRKKKV